MRRLLYCLFFVILFSLTFRLCEAAVIGPELRAVLQTAPSNQEVPIIINLSDRVDVNKINAPYRPGSGKALRRNAIAAALKDKADKTQGPIKALLQNRGGKKMKPLWITNSIAVTVTAATINELAGSPQIASIELDAVIQAMPIIPAPAGAPRWNIDRVNAPALWAAGITGSGSVVANFDTGVDVNHPDLKYRWRGGACSSPPYCPSWFDPYPIPNTNPPQYTTIPYGIPATGNSFTELDATHAHGTHTMGIMVGGSASGNAIGVAPGAAWIAAKIFKDVDGTSTVGTILSAFQWALAPAGDAANAPDVVNNSWTVGSQNSCDTSILTAISNLTAAGIEVVFAAGNVNPTPATANSSFSPANNAGVFAVGATDCIGSGCTSPSNIIAFYSAWGPSACDGTTPGSSPARTTNFPNIVAPGSNIRSSVPTGGRFGTYNNFYGTSMAAPHIAGAAALLTGAMPTLQPGDIEAAFQQTAVGLGSPIPNDTYGYGLLDAEAAYLSAFNAIKGNIPQIAALPPSAYFINDATSCTFDMFQNPPATSCTIVIANQGTADLTISGVSISGDFAITSGGDGCSGQVIPSLSSCSVTVTPGVAGARTGQLSVASDDASTPTLNLPLRGNDPVALVQGSAIVATYADIQMATGDCSNWDDIRLQTTSPATPLIESPVFDLPLGITVSLLGGYDPAFETQTGFTTVQGTLTVNKGTVIVGNLIVQ